MTTHTDHRSNDSPAAMAHVLAMFMATQPDLDPREVRMLEGLDAFRRIGMSKPEFLRIARQDRTGSFHALAGHAWLHVDDIAVVDRILDGVHDAGNRLLLCRLASCLITTDGRIEELESILYDRMLSRWGYTRSSVAQAILAEHVY